jgi:hypothetical protein
MVPLILVALSLLVIIAEAQSNPAKAHEYIRVVQEDGVWWFQDGSGRRFFSLGVNCVGGCYGHAEGTPIDPSRKARIVAALKGWDFNTAGSWSSPSPWDEFYVADRIYTYFSEITHDVFDESFWRASHQSFENIPATPPPKPYPPRMRQRFLKAWRTEVAVTYYRRYEAMVRALDPDHLILGIRHQGVPDTEFFRALAPYFDVHSINDYNRYGHLRQAYAELYQATGKPLMITEFSFSGFPHPGHQSSLFVDVYTQESRGVGYRQYVLQAARAPFMVGMHWFMWMDYARHDSVGELSELPPLTFQHL